MERAGFPVGPYLDLRDPLDPGAGFNVFDDTGRYSTGYTPLRNRAGLLVETHLTARYRAMPSR